MSQVQIIHAEGWSTEGVMQQAKTELNALLATLPADAEIIPTTACSLAYELGVGPGVYVVHTFTVIWNE
ncbi:MAG TPA: hypothetical protein VFS21_09160 [Roseiflexaceae bacterium]|nr:hypothetical protein [Roseiflexaceae bacterium]